MCEAPISAGIYFLEARMLALGNQTGISIARDMTNLREAQTNTLYQLSTPLIPIEYSILVMPLSGAIDTTRAQQML
jgi:hypothetical protein